MSSKCPRCKEPNTDVNLHDGNGRVWADCEVPECPMRASSPSDIIEDAISDWLFSLSEHLAVGLRGKHAAALRDSLVALLPAVPAGYALVPIEPTLAQLRAYCGALENPAAARKEMWHHAKARKRYRAMVLAAQQKE